MERITIYSKFIGLGVLCLSAPVWASYQPVTGSSITIFATGSGSLPVNLSTSGVNGSTVAVVPMDNLGNKITSTGNALDINIKSGSIANTGFNVNNTPAVLNAPGFTSAISSGSMNVSNLGIYLDSSAYTLTSSSVAPIGGVWMPNVQPLLQTSTTTAAARMTQYRSLYTILSDNNGVIQGTSTASAIFVQIPGAVQLASGTITVSVPGAIQLASGTLTVSVSNSPTVLNTSGFTSNIGTANVVMNGQGFTVVPGSGTWPVSVATPYTVILTTIGVNGSTSSVIIIDGSGNRITSTSNALDMNIKSGSIANTGFNVNNTPQVGNLGGFTANIGTANVVMNGQGFTVELGSGTVPVSVATPYTVILTTIGVNGSTSSVIIIDGSGNRITSTSNALDINIKSGSIANTGFNVNNTPTVLNASGFTANMGTSNVVMNGQGFTVIAGTGTWNSPAQFVAAAGSTVTASYQGVISSLPVNAMGSLGNNTNAATTNRMGTLPGIAQNAYGNNASVFTQGRDAGTMILSSSGLQGVWSGPDITFASYSASTNTFSLVAASTNTDVTALCGNSKNTVYLTGLHVSCTQTTAGNVSLSVMKRSSAYSSQVTWSTMTAVPEDANYGVVQSSAIFFTSGQGNNGTLLGHLDNYQLGCMATGTATPNDIYISPANWRMKPIVLRGSSQCVGVNFENTSMSGAKISVGWNWMEVQSP